MQTSNAVAVGGGVAVAAIAISTAMVLRTKSPTSIKEPPAVAAAVQRPAPIAPSPEEDPMVTTAKKLRAAKTLAEALPIVRPYMNDAPNESSLGTEMLALWGTEGLTWSDAFSSKDETTPELAKKDIDAERGKRVCRVGTIVQIAKKGSGPTSHFAGLLRSPRGDIFHFLAVRSTGSLVHGSRGRICGVITGLYDYDNSAGGTSHALDVVGMFDLPENKT